jgi:hypothetical protein
VGVRTIRGAIGAVARELKLLVEDRQQRGGAPAVLFMPSQGLDDGAARLRAYEIARELRRSGWKALVCPKHLGLAARKRVVRLTRPDVIVMQTARHPLNRPRHFSPVPCVIDIDDADYVDERQAPGLNEALRNSVAVIAGSRTVATYCRTLNPYVDVIWTGSPVPASPIKPHRERSRIVTWALSSPVGGSGETMFVRDVLERVLRRTHDFTFRLYADDGSAAHRAFVEQAVPSGVRVEGKPYLAYPDFLSSLDDVAVGLAPLVDIDGFSGGKSFGKVLAYLDRGVPVIAQPVVDHPLFFTHGHDGFLFTDPQDWADTIIRLLDDSEQRQQVADAGRASFCRRLTTPVAARKVDEALRRAIAREKGGER